MTTWYATVKAPQGGLIYVHTFEGADPSSVLRCIADAPGADPCEGMPTTGAADASDSQHGHLPLLGEGDN